MPPALPLVSIVTPSYQQAAFLEATLRSVLEQDYPAIEYFVIDGGSDDGSVDIIRRYEDRLAGWVSEPDRGQADAINKGFARARGEFVAWLNSDDLYLPGAVSAAVRALQAHPAASMCYADVVSLDGEGRPINVMTYAPWTLEDLMAFNILGQPAVFMRRAALEQAGGLDLSYHLLLDHHLWLRVAQYGPPVYTPERRAAARFHAAAKNVARAAEFGAEAYRMVDWMRDQPALVDAFRRGERRIRAGAARMDARYLLDCGDARGALRAYLRSLAASPGVALPEWRRILYAAVSPLIPLDALRRSYLERRRKRLE